MTDVSEKREEEDLPVLKNSVDALIQRLEDYIEKNEGGLITAIRNDSDNTMDNRMTITRKQKWEEKQLYGRFKRLITSHTRKPGRGEEKETLREKQKLS